MSCSQFDALASLTAALRDCSALGTEIVGDYGMANICVYWRDDHTVIAKLEVPKAGIDAALVKTAVAAVCRIHNHKKRHDELSLERVQLAARLADVDKELAETEEIAERLAKMSGPPHEAS